GTTASTGWGGTCVLTTSGKSNGDGLTSVGAATGVGLVWAGAPAAPAAQAPAANPKAAQLVRRRPVPYIVIASLRARWTGQGRPPAGVGMLRLFPSAGLRRRNTSARLYRRQQRSGGRGIWHGPHNPYDRHSLPARHRVDLPQSGRFSAGP